MRDPVGASFADRPTVLLVCATPQEAEPLRAALRGAEAFDAGWGTALRAPMDEGCLVLATLGVGKVNTAAGLATLLGRLRPRRVLQFGIGGAFPASFLGVGSVAVATVDVHTDTGAGEGDAWTDMRNLGLALLQEGPAGEGPVYNEVPLDAGWSRAVAEATGAPLVRFATSERVTGSFDVADALERRFDVAVESMEGAAAAQVCLAFGVPFAQLRAVSNVVGERNKVAWDVPGAIQAAGRAVLEVLHARAWLVGAASAAGSEGGPETGPEAGLGRERA